MQPTGDRRQLTLFVPEPLRMAFDAVRAQVDPIQHALIQAHATLVRDEDVDSWSVVQTRLEALGPVSVKLNVGRIRGDDYGGAYLPLEDPAGDFERLRKQLLIDQRGCSRIQDPHITLAHPRNRSSFGMELAELEQVQFPSVVHFDRVALIAKEPGQSWRVRSTSSL